MTGFLSLDREQVIQRRQVQRQHDELKFKRANREWAERTAGGAWPALGRRYMDIARCESYRRANTFINDYRELVRHDLYLADTDAGIQAFCSARVSECKAWLHAPDDFHDALRRCVAVLDRYGLDWPAPASPIRGPSYDLWPHAARLMCVRWWRRQVRRLQARVVDQCARKRERVAKYREVYVSDWAVKNRHRANHRNRLSLEGAVATNDNGQEYTLAALSDLSTANPKLRRNELMTRMRGFEDVAIERGHVGEFWTFTAAGKWHRMRWLKKPGKAVPVGRWNGATPKEVNDHLCKKWELIRAAFDRAGIRVYGFRVVEPHHDGTPHWHLLLFMRECDVRQARKICIKYLWWSESPHERNSRAVRFHAKRIDWRKGTATGYIAKYIAKNIDGEGVHGLLYEQDDDSGLDMRSAAVRVRAWASVWGIRQFQQVGGPSVTVWRELRRLWASDEAPEGQGDLFGSEQAYRAGDAADLGDWAAYVEAMGGPLLPRAERPLAPGYWLSKVGEDIDTETGELITHYRETTVYGDTAKGAVFGLMVRICRQELGVLISAVMPVLTRFYRWVITWGGAPPGFRGSGAAGAALEFCQ